MNRPFWLVGMNLERKIDIHAEGATIPLLADSLVLPEGCAGVLFVWNDAASAKAWYGEDVPLIVVQATLGQEKDEQK